MGSFEKSVFINCPFDEEYRQLLMSIIFTTKYLGFTPHLTLEKADSSSTRLTTIVEYIENSKFGIHDLSRLLATDEGEYARLNMPFELGIDYGCKKFKKGRAASKKILVLEKERYRYQKALSDLSGSDIKHHGGEPIELTRAVRDWFVTEELGTGPSHTKIWYEFNDFTADLEEQLIGEGHKQDDFEAVPVPEVMAYMDRWFEQD